MSWAWYDASMTSVECTMRRVAKGLCRRDQAMGPHRGRQASAAWYGLVGLNGADKHETIGGEKSPLGRKNSARRCGTHSNAAGTLCEGAWWLSEKSRRHPRNKRGPSSAQSTSVVSAIRSHKTNIASCARPAPLAQAQQNRRPRNLGASLAPLKSW